MTPKDAKAAADAWPVEPTQGLLSTASDSCKNGVSVALRFQKSLGIGDKRFAWFCNARFVERNACYEVERFRDVHGERKPFEYRQHG